MIRSELPVDAVQCAALIAPYDGGDRARVATGRAAHENRHDDYGNETDIAASYSSVMSMTIGMIVAGISCTLASVYLARFFLARQNRRNIKRLSRQVRMHLHRKRVLRGTANRRSIRRNPPLTCP